MTCPRIGRLKWPLIGLVFGPPVLWVLLVVLAPTERARVRLEAALKEATGHAVQLHRAALGLFGGLQLRGLEVSVPGHASDPWLHADDVVVDLNPVHLLLTGRGPLTRIEARGVRLRLRREAGGAFEFSPLLRTAQPHRLESPRPRNESEDGPAVVFQVRDGRLSVIDEPTGTRLELTELNAHGTWQRHHAGIEQLSGQLNGGPVNLTADLERGTGCPMFEGELTARQIEVGDGARLLSCLLPMLAGQGRTAALKGKLDLDLYLRGQGDTCDDLAQSLEGQGMLRFDPVRLADAGLLAELAKALSLPRDARLAAVHGPFSIGKRRIVTQGLVCDIGSLPVTLDGWTDFESHFFDYRVRSEALAGMIVPELKEILPDLPATVDEALDLRLRRGEGPLQITAGGLPIGTDASGRPLSSRDRLRDLARRLRDRMLR